MVRIPPKQVRSRFGEESVSRMPRMRNIRVTQRNASEVPLDWLHVRYRRLTRWIQETSKPKPEWELERSVIKEELEVRGRLELIQQQEAVQLELGLDVAVIHRNDYVPIVEERLREHYSMSRELAWLSQMPERYSDNMEGSKHLVASYGLARGNRTSGYANPVEDRVMRDLEQQELRQIRIKHLQKRMLPLTTILETKLTELQHTLISMKYLTRESPKDEYLMLKLSVGRQKYYNLKKQALQRIAYELGLI